MLSLGPRTNATTRHAVYVAALLASIVLPFVTGVSSYRLAEVQASGDSRMLDRPQTHVARPVDTLVLRERAVTQVRSAPTPGIALPSRFNVALPRAIVFGIIAIWTGGASFLLFRLILGLLHLERLKRDALPFAEEYRAQLTRWTSAPKGPRNVRLCTSSHIEIPIAVGFFEPMILVPDRLLGELEPRDVDSIVLHELAHLRRSDDWINALERIALALLFFNPAMAWLARHIDLEREVACDDWVLQRNDALPYAACLVKIVESTMWPSRAMGALGAISTRRGISVRIERLLAEHRDVRVRTSLLRAGTAVAILAILGLVATFASPSIAYSVSSIPLDRADRPSVVAAARTDAAQAEALPDSGTWAIRDVRLPNIEFEIRTQTPGDKDSWGRDERAPMVGLEPAQLMGSGADVRFTVVRDAGRLGCSGHVASGTGSGTFRYIPDGKYASLLVALGVSAPNQEQQRRMAYADVSLSFVRSLRAAGYAVRSAAELLRLAEHGVSETYVSALAVDGYRLGSPDALIAMVDHGVSMNFIESLRKVGFRPAGPDLVRLVDHGASADFVSAIVSMGYRPSVDQLVDLVDHGVPVGFAKAVISMGTAHRPSSSSSSWITALRRPSFAR